MSIFSISWLADKQCWPGQAFGVSIYRRGRDPRAAHCCRAGFWNIPYTQVIICKILYKKKLYNIDLQFVCSNVHQDLFSYHFSGLTPTTSLQNLIIPLSHAQALQMQLSGKNVKAEPSSPQDKGGSSEDEGPPEKQPRMSSDRWQYPLFVKIFDWKSCFMHKML